MGRPSKLTPVIAQAVLEILRNTGCSQAEAARHVRVAPSQLTRWMQRNAWFRNDVEDAINDFGLQFAVRARLAAVKDTRTLQWYGEHHPRLRAQWSQKAETTVTVAGPDGQAPRVEVTHKHGLSAGATDAIAQLAALAPTLDVLLRVGIIPQLGAGPASPDDAGAVVDAEVVEVHPREP